MAFKRTYFIQFQFIAEPCAQFHLVEFDGEIVRSLHTHEMLLKLCMCCVIMNGEDYAGGHQQAINRSTFYMSLLFSFVDLDVAILPSDTIAHCNAFYFNSVLVSVSFGFVWFCFIVFCNVSACAVKSVKWRAPDTHNIRNRDERARMLLNEMINRQMHAYAHGRLRTPMRENMNIIIKFEISNGNEQHSETINVLNFVMSINI